MRGRLLAGCDETSPQKTQPAHKIEPQEYILKAELAIQKLVETVRINGTSKATQDKYRTVLTQIAKHVDLFDTTAVKTYIADLKRTDNRKYYIRNNKPAEKPISISTGTKRNMINVYAVFCRENSIEFIGKTVLTPDEAMELILQGFRKKQYSIKEHQTKNTS